MSNDNDNKAQRVTSRKIIGISLSPPEADEFRIEAAKRGLKANELFRDMWAIYKAVQRDT